MTPGTCSLPSHVFEAETVNCLLQATTKEEIELGRLKHLLLQPDILQVHVAILEVTQLATLTFKSLHGRLRTVVSLRFVPVDAWGQSILAAHLTLSHASDASPVAQNSSGWQVVWCRRTAAAGFGISCLLHCGCLTVSPNSEDSWKRFCFCLSRTRLRHLVTLANRHRI